VTPIVRLRLEKAAADCGFECTPTFSADGTMELRSVQFPEVVLIRARDEGGFDVEYSSAALLEIGADEATLVRRIEELYPVLQRASAIARTIPNRVADRFRLAKLRLPQGTEAERMVVQRVGQDLFRSALLDYWNGRCCVTGLAVPGLLRASHIKPWAKCESDDERLDVFNGLLLAPHIDALFDGGWISFADEGGVLVSDALPLSARAQLGVSSGWTVHQLKSAHIPYMEFHRTNQLRHEP
jgi:putative restriction endonuclease